MKRYDILNGLVVFLEKYLLVAHTMMLEGIIQVTEKSAKMMLEYFRPVVMRTQGECEALCGQSMDRSEGWREEGEGRFNVKSQEEDYKIIPKISRTVKNFNREEFPILTLKNTQKLLM